MKMHRRSAFSRVVHNLHASAWAQLLGRLGSLITVPLFLQHWSPAYYGEYLTIFSVVGYLATIDMGFSLAIINRLTQLYATAKHEEYSLLQRAGLSIGAAIALFGTVCLALILPWVDVVGLLGFKLVDITSARLALLLLGAYVLWNIPWKLLSGAYQSIGLSYRAQWASNAQLLAGLVATILALTCGGGIVVIASFPLALLLVTAMVTVVDLRVHYPRVAPLGGEVSLSPLRALMMPSAMFSLLFITSLLWFQGSILVVALKFGGAAVTIFSVSRTLTMFVRSAIDAVGNATWAEITRLDAEQNRARLETLYRQNFAVSMALAVAIGVVVWTVGPRFISVWTQGHLLPDVYLLQLLVVLQVSQVPWQAGYPFVASTNQHRRFAVHCLIASVSSLVLAWVLADYIGIWALPVGALVGEMAMNWHYVFRNTAERVGIRYPGFAWRTWFALWGVFAFDVVITSVVVSWIQPLIPQMIASVLTALSVAAGLFFFLSLRSSDRAELLARLRPVRP